MKTFLIAFTVLFSSSAFAACDIGGAPKDWITDSCMWELEQGPESSAVRKCVRKALREQSGREACKVKTLYKKKVCRYQYEDSGRTRSTSTCMKDDFVPEY
ncbi:MAG: hypothetical protein OIF55_10720 [Amphritea sp.]|nr:hypothetical protein [Amphritea sp.]